MMKTKNTLMMAAMTVLLSIGGIALSQDSEEGSASSDFPDRHRRAGGHHSGSYNLERMLGVLTRRLELDDVQAQQLTNIVESAKPEFELLRERMATNTQATHELDVADGEYGSKLQNLMREKGELASTGIELFGRVRVEIHAILTAEQQQKFSASMDRQRGLGKTRRNHNRRQQSAADPAAESSGQ